MAYATSSFITGKTLINRISSITFKQIGSVVGLTRQEVKNGGKVNKLNVIYLVCSFSDWDANRYFNCTSSILGSREACGVPFSCCKTNSNDIIANKVSWWIILKKFRIDKRAMLTLRTAWINGWLYGQYKHYPQIWKKPVAILH